MSSSSTEALAMELRQADDRPRNVLPEQHKEHIMADKYEYINYDEASGLLYPVCGFFMVETPRQKFGIIAALNPNADTIPQLDEVTMDPRDFLLVSPMKTGTHLTFEIINMLAAGKADYGKMCKNSQWLELVPYDDIISSTESPRVLNTHLALSWLPPNFRHSDTKVVITMRNPKDIFVSWFHHLKYYMTKLDQGNQEDVKKKWNQCFDWALKSKTVTWTSFFDIMADAWDNYRSDPNVLILMFEDIKRRPVDTISRLAEHMGVGYTSQLIGEIASALDINRMRNAKSHTEEELRKSLGSDYTLFRKGEIGDWKNWFTEDQNEEFQQHFDEWNKTRNIPFVFE